MGPAMVGYGEIRYHDEATFYGWGNTVEPGWSMLHKELNAIGHQRFMTATVKRKEDVYQALQSFIVKRDGMGGTPEPGNAAFQAGR